MVRFTVRKDPKAPGYYFVSGGTIRGKYYKEMRVASKSRANEIRNARARLAKKHG